MCAGHKVAWLSLQAYFGMVTESGHAGTFAQASRGHQTEPLIPQLHRRQSRSEDASSRRRSPCVLASVLAEPSRCLPCSTCVKRHQHTSWRALICSLRRRAACLSRGSGAYPQILTFAAIVVLRRAFQAGHAAHDASQEASVHPGGSTAPSASPQCACYVSLAWAALHPGVANATSCFDKPSAYLQRPK